MELLKRNFRFKYALPSVMLAICAIEMFILIMTTTMMMMMMLIIIIIFIIMTVSHKPPPKLKKIK